jgi:acetoin utilization protein AcuB
MGVRMVGSNVVVSPIAFNGCCEVRGRVPPGCPEVEERLVCSRFRCQKGGPERTGNDCLVCSRYRGWRDGPGTSTVTVTCGWSSEAPVWQCMTRDSALVTVPPTLTVGEATEQAIAAEVHHLLVTENDQLVGVVCRCDLDGHRRDWPLSACISTEVFAIESSATLAVAAGAMADLGVGCLPVLEQGRLVGVITDGDLFAVGGPPATDPFFDPRDYGEGD